MKPSKYLYFPIKNGEWLRDSQGRPRVYKSAMAAVRNLKNQDYDSMQIYAIDDVVSRREFESYDLKSFKVLVERDKHE